MVSNPRLEAALAYAARGWAVFPCQPGHKVPATANGHLAATFDPFQIEAWWKENPDYNVAISCGPSNLFVIDVDPQGQENWDTLVAETPGLKDIEDGSLFVETPRGGFHLYLEGEGPTSSSKLAPGIDTRGKGGYVLAPPSYVDDGKAKGSYSGQPHADTLRPVFAPLVEKLKRKAVEVVAPITPPEEVQWDLPETLNRAEAYLATLVGNGEVAIEGEGGDAKTFEVSCRVLEMGISPERAFDLLLKAWNPYCSPPWDAPELQVKVHNAWKYGQETKGGKAQPPLEQTFQHLVEQQAAAFDTDRAALEEKYRKSKFFPQTLYDAYQNLEPMKWLVPDLIPEGGTSIFYGESEAFKSFLTLDLGLSLATGHGQNWWKDHAEPRKVLFISGEGATSIKGKRREAWMARNLMPEFLVEKHFKDNFRIVTGVPPFELKGFWQELADTLAFYAYKPDLVVIDTLSRAMVGWDESSNKDAAKGIERMEWFGETLGGAHVMAIHHVGKDEERGARGSSIWRANVDAMFMAKRHGESSLLQTVLTVQKQKDGEKPPAGFMFRGHPYGESIAFARDWNWTPEKEQPKVPAREDTEEWKQPEAIKRALNGSPMKEAHLADTLSTLYDVQQSIVKAGLRLLRSGRYKAWCPNGDDVWVPLGEEF